MTQNLLPLIDKCNDFAKKLAGEWKDSEPFDARGFQLRYLYSNAYRAAHTAFSFWKLNAMEHYHDSHVLARVLFERIINGRIASRSPTRAVTLMSSEIANEIDKVTKWQNLDELPGETQTYLARRASELKHFLGLAGIPKPPVWNFCALAKEVDCESLYPSAYRDLSQYSHAGYNVSRPGQGDRDCLYLKFVALIAPVESAAQFDFAQNGQTSDEVKSAYEEIFEEVAKATVRPDCRMAPP